MADFENWARKPETKARLALAKKNAWEEFTKQFPNADKTQFRAQTSVYEKYRITSEVFFNESEGSSVSVFGSDRKYWSQKMKTALGLAGLEGFPYHLSPLKTKTALPIPAVDFTEPAPSIAKIFNQENRIYAKPDKFFVTKFRYQLAVDEVKVRLNLAVCPGAWLMPARMIINTESIVGYNNKLKQAQAGMKLGVNNSINLGTKKSALQLMDGGPSKINPPNSHPSNPIHKAATQSPQPTQSPPLDTTTQTDSTPQHEINKTAVIVGVVAVIALLFMASR